MKTTLHIASLALGLAAAPAFPGDIAPNYFIANCYNCHGTDGQASGAMPSLAGLDKNYIVQQIAAFKSGTRPATVMHQLAKGYTDEEIARAADYFSKQRTVAKK